MEMEEVEKGEILERNIKRSSMEEAEKGEVLERNTMSRLDDHPGATAEAASLFTDDIILEILSRLPARSVNRFKCVSMAWRDLIADPANRKKLPQTLAGFLYTTVSERDRLHYFATVSGAAAPFDPCLHPNKDESITHVDACNGLLLYQRYKRNKDPWTVGDFSFVVCNPATGRWIDLPPQPQAQANRYSLIACLTFNPAVSFHFHVLCFEQAYMGDCITGVSIYSSQTGVWSHRDCGMVEKVRPFYLSTHVFVGDTMYMSGNLHINDDFVLVGVDMEGKVWTTIPVPYPGRFGMIGSSQGCLHYAIAPTDGQNNILVSERAIWWLKDRERKGFILKHTVSIDKLMSMTRRRYRVVGIHPDCDTIFLVSSEDSTFVSYDMQHQKVGRILNLEKENAEQFLPYVPLFSESLADAAWQ